MDRLGKGEASTLHLLLPLERESGASSAAG
jgi:hypothetical protein